MATVNAYGVKFIGNDIVAPRVRQRVRTEPVQRTQYAYTAAAPALSREASIPLPQEPSPAVVSTQVAPARPLRTFPRLFSVRYALVALSAIAFVAVADISISHLATIEHVASRATSKLTVGIRDDMHHTSPASFAMPAHSLLVKNSVLASYTDAIESQSITINIGTNAVSPLPSDIAQWFKVSAGPQKDATLLTVNTASITKYVTSAVQRAGSQSSGASVDGNPVTVSGAVNEIASALLAYKGVTLTVQDNN